MNYPVIHFIAALTTAQNIIAGRPWLIVSTKTMTQFRTWSILVSDPPLNDAKCDRSAILDALELSNMRSQIYMGFVGTLTRGRCVDWGGGA